MKRGTHLGNPLKGNAVASVTKIQWAWGQNQVINFNSASDTLDFGWFQSGQYAVSEVNGSVVIAIPSNNQTYTLSGVSLNELSLQNIRANDSSVVSAWQKLLADAPAPVQPTPLEPAPVEPTPVDQTPVDPTPVEPTPVVPPAGGGDGAAGSLPIIAAYYPEWAIYSRDFNVADIPAGHLTHLIYAFSKIDTSGRMSLFDSYAAIEKTFSASDSVDGKADTWDQTLAGNFNQLAELKAANPALKTMIAVGGWTLSGPFSDVASTAEGRATFADSAFNFLQKYTMFDGIDFDWEYPGGGGLESNIVRPEDGKNYALLLQEVRDRLDTLEVTTGREYQISIASPAGADKIANMDLAGMKPSVDFFNLMAYDFHGGWETTTGHQAPMFDTIGGNYDIATAVDLYLAAGVEASAIVLGTPAYTRAWSGVQDGGDGGWNAPSTGLAQGSFERGVYDYKDIVDKVTDPDSDWEIYWDDEAQAAYTYSASEQVFSTMETPASIALKSQWAQSKGLGGLMLWDLSGDVSSGPESLSSAAYQSWYAGASVDTIATASALSPDHVIGGNGAMDSFVDYVYEPPVVIPPAGGGTSGTSGDSGGQNGGSAPPTQTDLSGQTYGIGWSWGKHQVLDFKPDADTLDFGWAFQAGQLSLTEANGSTVLAISSNSQSYILNGVSLDELSLANFASKDAGVMAYFKSVLDAADVQVVGVVNDTGLVL